jgi:alkanesulfonate monooxygenase SsuD/methylene tetrahydromethanopterin reductase-like flavin-dependent oxidoreductase (luciferase family)
MDLGLHYWNFANPSAPAEIAATLTSAAEIAEQEGLAEFSVVDHFFQMEHVAPAEEPMLEAYATLAYVAARTKRIRLAALVTGVLYRYPGVLAKLVTTLDVLSGGRAQLGLGASWYEREQRGLGVPVVSVRNRVVLQPRCQSAHSAGPKTRRYQLTVLSDQRERRQW